MTDTELYGPHKVCTTCKRDLPALHFPIDRRRKDGLRGNCRDCCRNENLTNKALKRRHEESLVRKEKKLKFNQVWITKEL